MPDIDLAISFLYARVTKCSKEDWEKLRRLLRYINGTIKIKRTIGAVDLGVARTWVNVFYVTHKDMKSHTGGIFSMEHGSTHHKFTKQKLIP